jgi:hypothetical protein
MDKTPPDSVCMDEYDFLKSVPQKAAAALVVQSLYSRDQKPFQSF